MGLSWAKGVTGRKGVGQSLQIGISQGSVLTALSLLTHWVMGKSCSKPLQSQPEVVLKPRAKTIPPPVSCKHLNLGFLNELKCPCVAHLLPCHQSPIITESSSTGRSHLTYLQADLAGLIGLQRKDIFRRNVGPFFLSKFIISSVFSIKWIEPPGGIYKYLS